jgi:hypothetical protein
MLFILGSFSDRKPRAEIEGKLIAIVALRRPWFQYHFCGGYVTIEARSIVLRLSRRCWVCTKITSMAELDRNDHTELKFAQSRTEPRSWLPWVIAGAAIAVGLGLVIAFGGHRTSAPLAMGPGMAPADAYATNLAITDLKMSEASNFAGGKVTYLDGKIANQGDRTLTAVTVQVAFRSDLKEIAQKETLPLSLIRTREPYVDTQPVSASPLKPGEQREFRLIFDSLAPDWNQQYPEVRIVQVTGQAATK